MTSTLVSLSLCLSALQASAARGPAYSLADYDGDGLLDAYVVHPGGEDRLFRSLGDGSFLDVTAEAGLTGLSGSRDALWQDFDGDGAVDLYVSFLSGRGRLFQNTGVGVFVDASEVAGLAPAEGELDAAWLDYDGDLQPDLYVATLAGDLLYRNAGSGRFERVELVPLADEAGAIVLAPAAGVASEPAGGPAAPREDAGPRAHRPRRALDLSGLGGAPRFAQPLSVGSAPSPASQPLVLAPSACATALRDAVVGGCTLLASNTPTLGMLYPMSTALNVSVSGNVGIGTSTPVKRLHVDQPASPGDGVGVLFGPSYSPGPYNEGNQRVLVAAWNGNPGLSLVRHNQLGFLTEVDTNGLAIKEGYAGEVGERMRVQLGTGNVGIGTAAPTAKLQVQTSGAGQDAISASVPGGAADAGVAAFAADQSSIRLIPKAAEGAFNALTQTNDNLLLYTGPTLESGSLTIGSWSASSKGMRIDPAGRVGIGTGAPTAGLHVQRIDGVLATGTYGSGTIPTEGPGVRMMWYPGKAAFRAGQVTAAQWNDVNVGIESAAIGENTTASDIASIALGSNTTASGERSTAMGFYATASGLVSTAMGRATIASHVDSFAAGSFTTASGVASTAMGLHTRAESYGGHAVGSYNVGGGSAATWFASDPLFEIGNGTSDLSRANALTVLKNGNVGIGDTTPSFQLELSLNSAAKPSSNTWTISSDERLKKNIAPLRGALERLLELRGVTFDWIDPASQGGCDWEQIGLIAQEVEKVFPHWVGTDSKGYKTLTVAGFEALTVESLRELKSQNEEWQRRAEELQRHNEELEARIARLESAVETLAGWR